MSEPLTPSEWAWARAAAENIGLRAEVDRLRYALERIRDAAVVTSSGCVSESREYRIAVAALAGEELPDE